MQRRLAVLRSTMCPIMLAVSSHLALGVVDRGPPSERPQDGLWALTTDSGAKIAQATVRLRPPELDSPGAAALGGCAPFGMLKASPMYRSIHGIASVIEPREVRLLAAMSLRRPDGMMPVVGGEGGAGGVGETLYTVSMCPAAGVAGGDGAGEVRRAELVLCPDGSVWARPAATDSSAKPGAPSAAPPSPQSLDREKFYQLADDWSWYAGPFDASGALESVDLDAVKPAKAPPISEFPQPYVPARWKLDRPTVSTRFLRGRQTQLDPADRVLELEKLFVRVPAGYSAREPAGLLVWIDAGDEGRPPECLFEALDQLNIIAAGFARCGNTRPVANRYQLALDAVATVSRRLHVDRRRVYVSGISGGGRVSSMMVACFPDVFTGAVPIVGLSCPENVPVGGGRHVPAAYARPQGKLMDLARQHRVGAITGAKDFNQAEINGAAQILRADGVPVKVFEHMDMGHELPTAERLTEALKWVDEPWQKLRKAEVEAGERELRTAMAKLGADAKVNTDADRAALMRVTELAPWTPSAWKAAQMLDERASGKP